jgi:exodeoxyribonuclease V alpha subunit
MTSNLNVNEEIKQWIKYGWLSHTDRAFVNFLIEMEPAANDLLLWASALVSHQLSQGEVFLDLAKLSRNLELTLGISVQNSEQKLEKNFVKISSYTLNDWKNGLVNSTLVTAGEGESPMVLDGDRLYLRRYWFCQQLVSQSIKKRLKPIRFELPEALKNQVQQLFMDNRESPDWQKIACVIALRAQFSIITGGPGTGKTTTLIKLLAIFIQLAKEDDFNKRKLNILLAAPTGKAAARVSDSINSALTKLRVAEEIKNNLPNKAITLHRLLGSQPSTRYYRHNHKNPLLADIVIVDEASMIDLEMMAALLDALPQTSILILLGDKDQLASVEAGSVFGDLCKGAQDMAYEEETQAWIMAYADEKLSVINKASSNIINQQTVILRDSHRFASDSGIGQLARAVNEGDYERAQIILHTDNYSDLSPNLGSNFQNLRSNPTPDLANSVLKQLVKPNNSYKPNGQDNFCQGYEYYRQIIKKKPQVTDSCSYDQWAQKVLTAFDTFQVLCALRQGPWGVEGLNQRIEKWLNDKQILPLWYEGRPVMISSNDYTLGLMNGDIGITLRDHNNNLRVVFGTNEGETGESLRWISPLRLPHVETAYAMTVHKSQGSEFSHVVLVLPEVQSRVLTRELIYTGITRAKENFTLVETGPKIFIQAIKTTCCL